MKYHADCNSVRPASMLQLFLDRSEERQEILKGMKVYGKYHVPDTSVSSEKAYGSDPGEV